MKKYIVDDRSVIEVEGRLASKMEEPIFDTLKTGEYCFFITEPKKLASNKPYMWWCLRGSEKEAKELAFELFDNILDSRSEIENISLDTEIQLRTDFRENLKVTYLPSKK